MISASRQKRANASWFPCSSGSSSLTAKLPGQADVLRLVNLAHRAAPDAAADDVGVAQRRCRSRVREPDSKPRVSIFLNPPEPDTVPSSFN